MKKESQISNFKFQELLFIFPFLVCLLLGSRPGAGSDWFARNQKLKIIFPASVWEYVEKADSADNRRDPDRADYYLRLAQKLTEEGKPFFPADWPRGWPKSYEAMNILRYAAPDAYMYRIIGDFARAHGRPKEAILFYQKYLGNSIIPDSDYLQELAAVLEAENHLEEALLVRSELYKNILNKNYHGTEFSLKSIGQKIRGLEARIRKPRILVLDASFLNVPDFLQTDFNNLYKQGLAGLKEVEIVPEPDFRRVLTEEGLSPADLGNDQELSRVSKILNASHVVKSVLSRLGAYYILQVKVFSPQSNLWFQDYEYKNQDFQYLPNFLSRFNREFLNQEIPPELYLPEKRILWSYETDSDITDAEMTRDGRKQICGSENGSVYLLNDQGGLIRKLHFGEKIVKVALAPDGSHCAWFCLDGKLYFADGSGRVLWSHRFENLGRALAVSRAGVFSAAGVNNRVFFLDRKGEIFWDRAFSAWITALAVPQDANRVALGLENGEVWNINEEGNVLWNTTVRGRVVRMNFAPQGEFLGVENDQGEINIFGSDGKPLIVLTAGEEKKLMAFSKEILYVLTGQRKKVFYFISRDGEKLWNYQIDDKVNFLESSADGKYSLAVENKNLFYTLVDWK